MCYFQSPRVISCTSKNTCGNDMPSHFEPSSIKNKIKREEISRKSKKSKGQAKLQRRLTQAKLEANDPAVKKVNSVHHRWDSALKIGCSLAETSSGKCPPNT